MRCGDPFVPFFTVCGYGTPQHSLDFSASRPFRTTEIKGENHLGCFNSPQIGNMVRITFMQPYALQPLSNYPAGQYCFLLTNSPREFT